MNNDSSNFPPDPYENLKKYTPHTDKLGFELKAATTQFLGAVEQIGPDITLEQAHPLELDLRSAQVEAIFRAFASIEFELAKLRHGITDEDLTDLE